MINSILKRFPSNKRLYKSSNSPYESWLNNSCIFGIAHHNNPLSSIDIIPFDVTNFYSFFGEASYDFLNYMIENGIHENLEHLTIGFEHSNSEYGYKDYSKISSLLSTAKFPKLKTFEYGTDFLIVNEEQYYPHLGDLTQVLNNMPLLEELDVSGSFQLQSKVDLKNIKNLYIMDYYTEITNGTISKDTINFLTDSNLENLEIFELSLGAQNDYVYQLNSKIFLKNIDKLKLLAIDGKFEKGTKDKLQTLLNPYIEKLFLNDTEE